MIKVERVEKSYNGEAVLKSVSLEISKGEFVSIMGESGSGKSTLLSIMGGFLNQDRGEVYLLGKNILDYTDNKIAELRCSEIGFVFQSFKLIPTLNVRDNILLPPTLGGSVTDETLKYMNKLSEELGIDAFMEKYPDQLSGGQCQRVAIIRALVYRPSLVILDEPTGALDSGMEERVMKLLSRINKEQNTTIVQVTHSSRVAEYGNRTIRLSDGEISL